MPALVRPVLSTFGFGTRAIGFAETRDSRSGLRPSFDDRPDREQGDDGDDLGPEDDLVEIDGGPPGSRVAPVEEAGITVTPFFS